MRVGLILSEIADNERVKKVTVEWSFPRQLDKNWYSEKLQGKGLYYISRIFGNKETLLYIGQTSETFYSRLLDHDWKWMNRYRGVKYFRLGTITYPTNKTDEEMTQLVKDVESTLIYHMKPIENVKCTISYAPKHLYTVKNVGYRGELPAEPISMREHTDA